MIYVRRIDSAPLKGALTAHCNTWQNKFTQLLNSNAATELGAMYEHIADVSATFRKKPTSLDQLAEQAVTSH